MDYELFRAAWHDALNESGMLPYIFPPNETIDLRHMSRSYHVTASVAGDEQPRPFYVSLGLSWVWDALQSARTATVEEDLLEQLLGEESRSDETEPPWLRVDVNLWATLPAGSPLPLPDLDAWHRWVDDVMSRLEPLLYDGDEADEAQPPVLAWRGEPVARLHWAPDGQILLTGVELAAWQGIDLPRHFDDPEREWDEDPADQLVDFARRVWEAVHQWADTLPHLLPENDGGEG
jgi:hypothetical protein